MLNLDQITPKKKVQWGEDRDKMREMREWEMNKKRIMKEDTRYKFVLNLYIKKKKLHTCASLIQYGYMLSYVCVSACLSHTEQKGAGDENVHLVHAALLLDFIKTSDLKSLEVFSCR